MHNFSIYIRVYKIRWHFQHNCQFWKFSPCSPFWEQVKRLKRRTILHILCYAAGSKWCCETELGEVSHCESLVTHHHFGRAITQSLSSTILWGQSSKTSSKRPSWLRKEPKSLHKEWMGSFYIFEINNSRI